MPLSKNTPVTDIVLMEPFGPRPGSEFGEIKDSVIVTPALALITDDRVTETSVASPAKIGGNKTPAKVSTGD
jgi:hypothetical protein